MARTHARELVGNATSEDTENTEKEAFAMNREWHYTVVDLR
jgi:hypothetical protein